MSDLGDFAQKALSGSAWGLGFAAAAALAMLGLPRVKPLAKEAVKGYLVMSNQVREWTAEASEQLQDIYAEARHEVEAAPREEQAPATAGGKTAKAGQTE